MEALRPTYMLPPNFRLRPDGDIQLGAIIGHDRKTNLPDPTCLLNQGDIVPPTSVEHDQSRDGENWQGSVTDKANGKIGLWADIASLPLGGGIEFGGGRDESLQIECKKMTMSWFVPDRKYHLQAFGYEWVQKYTKPPFGDPAYLVTGIMVGEDATIEMKKGGDTVQKLKLGLDGTAIGIPVNVGPDLERERNKSSTTRSSPSKPFILAYELVRLKRVVLSAKTELYTKHAVFDDKVQEDGKALDEDWDLSQYTAECQD